MNKKLSFAVENIIPIEDSNLDKSQFALLKVDAFATGRSWHDTYTTEGNLRKNAPTLLQKPFVFFTDKRFDDAGGHDDGEVAAGFVPHNSRLEFRTLNDGRVMLSCDVLVWRRYSGDLLKFFNRDGGKKGVSVEIEIYKSQEDPKSGLLELIDYCFDAITCLGDLIRPAILDAEAVLAFSKEFQEAKKEYETEFASKYDDLDFSIPSGVKKAAQTGLDLRKEYGRGGTSVGLATARYLVKNFTANPEKVRHIAKYFPRHAGDNLDDKTSNGWIAWQLWGGSAGRKWSTNLVERMNELDEKKMSYFSDLEKDMSSFEEGSSNPSEKEEDNMAGKKKKDEAVETENQEVDMAAEAEKEEVTSEEQKQEDMSAETEEENKEEQEENMSVEEGKKEDEFSFGFDTSVAMSLMPEDDEMCRNARGEFEKGKDANFGLIMQGMYAALVYCNNKMQQMASDKDTYMGRMSELETFKSNIETEQKKFAVDLTIKELSEKFIVSEEDANAMREEGYKANFSELENWKTSVRAKAVVEFSVIQSKENDGIIRIPLTNLFNVKKPEDGDLWEASKQ